MYTAVSSTTVCLGNNAFLVEKTHDTTFARQHPREGAGPGRSPTAGWKRTEITPGAKWETDAHIPPWGGHWSHLKEIHWAKRIQGL